MARSNTYPGPCLQCGNHVAAAAGNVVKTQAGWKVQCRGCAGAPAAAPAAPRVTVREAGSSLVVVPVDRLGDRFRDFKAACDAAGGRWSKETGETRIANLVKAGGLIQAFVAAGLAPDVTPGARALIEGAVATVATDIASAEGRANAVDAILAARGGGLYPFQRDGVRWLAPRRGALLADDMGLGKTIQVLASLPDGAPVLVVCPAVAKGVWKTEAAKWRPDLQVTVLAGRGSFRWPAPGEMVIVNYDILPGELEKGPNGQKLKRPAIVAESIPTPPDGTVVVADEAHALKSTTAARTARFRAMAAAARKHAGRTWLLTATPLLNVPPELWSVLQAADLATEAFGSWTRFVDMMGGEHGDFGMIWHTPDRAAVTAALHRVSLRRRKTDVLTDLPAKSWRSLRVDVKLSAEDKQLIAEAERELKGKGYDLAVADAMIHALPSFETLSRVRAMLAERKIPAMLALIEDYEEQNEPLVVFSAHRAPIDLLGAREGWAVITGDTAPERRADVQRMMQEGLLKGVACTIKAGGVAITLTRASNALFVDREWTPALNSQAEDRIYRIGQSRPVTITSLAADVPIDWRIDDLLATKAGIVAESTDAASVTTVVHDTMTLEIDWEALEHAVLASEQDAAADEVVFPLSQGTIPGAHDHRETPEERETRRRTGRMRQRLVDTRDEERFQPRDDRETWIASAIQQLAAMDGDRALIQNDMGFSKSTGSAGHTLSLLLASCYGLTASEWADAARIVRIHRRQVGELGDPSA